VPLATLGAEIRLPAELYPEWLVPENWATDWYGEVFMAWHFEQALIFQVRLDRKDRADTARLAAIGARATTPTETDIRHYGVSAIVLAMLDRGLIEPWWDNSHSLDDSPVAPRPEIPDAEVRRDTGDELDDLPF